MRLNLKLHLSFAGMALVILGVGVSAVWLSGRLVSVGDSALRYEEVRTLLKAREVDHHKWAAKVRDLFITGAETAGVQTDDHRCELGKFMYGGELEDLAKMAPDLGRILTSLGEPHMKLHASVVEIEKKWAQRKRDFADDKAAKEGVDEAEVAAMGIFTEETLKALSHVVGILDEASALAEARSREATSERNALVGDQRDIMTAVMGGGLAASLLLAYVLSGSIVGPVVSAAKMAEAISSGRQCARLEARGLDEISDMSRSLNTMADFLEDRVRMAEEIAGGNLRMEVKVQGADDRFGNALFGMVANLRSGFSEIRTSVEGLSSGAAQLAAASQNLSDGASRQAAGVEELSAAITELSNSANGNARAASDTDCLLRDAAASAQGGRRSVEAMVNSMERIREAGHKIAGIIGEIDGIAFQTNLLALNAAVEAARAGRHGKGFSVVAEEVRNLAKRSARASAETGALIESTLAKVKEGSADSVSAAAALAEIVERISGVTDLMGRVKEASLSQETGLSQMVAGVSEIGGEVQAVTSTAEETAASAQELSSQAEDLRKVVSRFRL